jgi:glutaconate CoA-transferase subunit A
VLIVAEHLVPTETFRAQPEMTIIPYFMVEAFSVVSNGAWPGSCWPEYGIDYPAVERYVEQGEAGLQAHLQNAPEAQGAGHV